MENPDISSSTQKSSLTNYFPPVKELGIRALTYGATSLLMGRINPVSLSISTFNAITVSFATKFTSEDDKALKKIVITVLSLAAATFVATKAAPALAARAAITITQDFVIKLAFFNMLGEAVLFSIPYLAKWNAPKLPESVEALEKLSEKNFLYMRNHFDNYAEMTPEVFAAFVSKLEEMKKEDILPKPPATLEEIQQLDTFAVRYAHTNPDEMKDKIERAKDNRPLWEALHLRFYEQDLPLPGEKTIQEIYDEKRSRYFYIKIDPLPTIEEVKAFSVNKLSWLFCHFHYNYGDFSIYSINDQIAMNELFDDKFKVTYYYSPTQSNIVDLSDENAKTLHAYYTKVIKDDNSKFICLPMDVKKALNERFSKLPEPLSTFGTTYKVPELAEIPNGPARTWQRYFTANPEEWSKVDKERQEAFNKLFSGAKLDSIPVTHKD